MWIREHAFEVDCHRARGTSGARVSGREFADRIRILLSLRRNLVSTDFNWASLFFSFSRWNWSRRNDRFSIFIYLLGRKKGDTLLFEFLIISNNPFNKEWIFRISFVVQFVDLSLEGCTSINKFLFEKQCFTLDVPFPIVSIDAQKSTLLYCDTRFAW